MFYCYDHFILNVTANCFKPVSAAEHGKQCWISGWDHRDGRDRHLIEVNAFSCDTSKDSCSYANQYCVDHSDYEREFQEDGTTGAVFEADDKKACFQIYFGRF